MRERTIATFAVRPADVAEFSPDRFTAVSLARTDDYKVMVLGFEPGQFIPVHTPGNDLVALVLEGRGYAEAGGQRVDLEPGLLFGVPGGRERGIYAEERLVVLAFVSPLPGPGDHDAVAEGLRQGRFRPLWPGDAGGQPGR